MSLTGPAQSMEKAFFKESVPKVDKCVIFLDGLALNHDEPYNFEFEDETHDGTKNYRFNSEDPNSQTAPNYIVFEYHVSGAHVFDRSIDIIPACRISPIAA
ncbi:ATS3 [Caenorhabditis elegans]|uniref:ATS3 n=1 Tax=Caenorhabditis elegans TaxID=6239 RepID=Q9TXR5_CAEEL|nr:ATS3 [Caenorhabditis elegans]CCD73000.2 ATS3 [Caenorhabditis elegans]